jgi:hypothetical protein
MPTLLQHLARTYDAEMTATLAPPPGIPTRTFQNVAELIHALGDIPPSRIILNPLPGTATEADVLRFVERDKRLCEQ